MDGWMEIAKGISLLIHINYNTDIQFIFLFNDVAMFFSMMLKCCHDVTNISFYFTSCLKSSKNGFINAILRDGTCLNISHYRDNTNYTNRTIICVPVRRHKSGLVYGVANSPRSKGMLFYRCLDKIVYAQFPSCSSIHNSSWHGIPAHSCNPTRC